MSNKWISKLMGIPYFDTVYTYRNLIRRREGVLCKGLYIDIIKNMMSNSYCEYS